MGLSEGWKGFAQATGLAVALIAAVAGGAYLFEGPDAFRWGPNKTASQAVKRCVSPADSAMVIGQARQVGLVVDTKIEAYNLILVVDSSRFARADYATVRGVAVAYFCGLDDNNVGVRSVEFRASPSGEPISRFSSADLRAVIR